MPAKYNEHNSIMRAVKRAFSRSPAVREVREKAIHPTAKGPRGGKRYICNECKDDFAGKEVQVDHIEPVIPIGTAARDMTWDEILKRLFCSILNLQLLCKVCHAIKSKIEAGLRRKARAKKK